MKNKYIKILILIMCLCIIPVKSFGVTAIDDVVSDGDKFLQKGIGEVSTVIDEEQLKNVSSDIYNLVLAIGMVIAVAVGVVLGIQFMMSSIDEKAKVKETLIVYFVGCAVLFGAFTIWKIVIGILGTI